MVDCEPLRGTISGQSKLKMKSEISIQVKKVGKKFKNTVAVDNISLAVRPGEIFGLIGPDGAGKTTLMRIIATLLLADQGNVSVQGFDVIDNMREVRKIIGYMPGRFSLYHDLTVEENLNFFAAVFGTEVKENYDLIKGIYSHIEPYKDRRAGNLSGGMKQKLALSCALIHRPQVLILDEPNTGVDAVSRKDLWNVLTQLQNMGITIMVSTPYMDEAEMCERVALMQKGRVLSIDTPDAIIHNFDRNLFSVSSQDIYRLISDLRKFNETRSVFLFGHTVHLTFKRDRVEVQQLRDFLKKNHHTDISIKSLTPTIEDCFIELMGKLEKTH